MGFSRRINFAVLRPSGLRLPMKLTFHLYLIYPSQFYFTLFSFQGPPAPHDLSCRPRNLPLPVRTACFFSLLLLLTVVVGSSGLEPPTLRLSGARSNHLSYEPIVVWAICFRICPTEQSVSFVSPGAPGWLLPFGSRSFPAAFRRSVLPSRASLPVIRPSVYSRSASGATGGGDEEVRTPDPLRARQVLSQLSYTPIPLGVPDSCHSLFVKVLSIILTKRPFKIKQRLPA